VSGFVDLHVHSTASDGSAAPADVVTAARAAALQAIALTDHDTVDGLPEARAAGASLGVEVIAGVELSAVLAEEEIHVLGLQLTEPSRIASALAVFRSQRYARAEAMVQALNRLGTPVKLDAVLTQAAGGAIGRPHVARALIAGGWARDMREAFERFIGNNAPAYVAKPRLAVADAVALVHAAGGVAVYAHPGRGGTLDRIRTLAADGMDGVEVRHPSHSAEDVARLGAIAQALELVPSGGSDWHGVRDGTRVLGCMAVPAAWSEEQAARAERYRVSLAS
jgi:hypothetical protein